MEVVFHHYHHTININIVVRSFYPCWGHGGLGTNDCDNKIMMIDLLLLLRFVSLSSVLETAAETEWAEDWSRATLQPKYIAAQRCGVWSLCQWVAPHPRKKSEILNGWWKSNLTPNKCLKKSPKRECKTNSVPPKKICFRNNGNRREEAGSLLGLIDRRDYLDPRSAKTFRMRSVKTWADWGICRVPGHSGHYYTAQI